MSSEFSINMTLNNITMIKVFVFFIDPRKTEKKIKFCFCFNYFKTEITVPNDRTFVYFKETLETLKELYFFLTYTLIRCVTHILCIN